MEPKDEIKSRLDVVDIASEYLQLKPAGSGSFKALCPFHGEKSPSFYVSREKQIWHCFGCGKGGDLISLVMEIEGMDFIEALQHLGKKAGVEVKQFEPKGSDEKRVLLDIHEVASKFYETIYWKHESAKVARDYLASRGVDAELIRKFHIGFAPDRWDSLVHFLTQKGFDFRKIEQAGLIKKRQNGGGYIDRFRNRVMIPLCDSAGRVIGFTGRSLPGGDDRGPKYLNSPETQIYHKSDVLFGLNLAKAAIRAKKRVVVVEGNLDVVASHKAGVEEVVASSGTALTESQLQQLKRFTTKIHFCFDADAAGFAAAKRGIRLAQSMGFDVGVISIPTAIGKDPDDVVQKDPEAWKRLTEKPIHIMEYYFDKAVSVFDHTDVNKKREMAHFILEEVSHLPDQIDREHWLQRLSDTIRVEVPVLRGLLEKDHGGLRSNKPITGATLLETAPKKPVITSKLDQAASFLLGLALTNEDVAEELFGRLDIELLPEAPWRPIYKELVLSYTAKHSSETAQNQSFSSLRDHLHELFGNEVQRIDASILRVEQMVHGMTKDKVREEMNRHIAILNSASIDAKKKQLEAAIRQAESRGDSERLRALMTEYSKLI